MMTEIDHECPDCLQDNVLYYISGFIVRSLLRQLQCTNCGSMFLLDSDDPHAFRMSSYPIQARFTCFKQQGGLIFLSLAVLRILKGTEVLFKTRVIAQEIGIIKEKNQNLKDPISFSTAGWD